MAGNTEQIHDIAFRNFQGFFPENDVDGIDTEAKFMRSTDGIEFKNGFISNAKKGQVINMPSNVSADMDAAVGYSLIYVASVNLPDYVGELQRLYVLQKATYEIEIYIENELLTIHTPPSDNNYTLVGAAENINHVVIGDEIRLNLNCYAEVTLDSGSNDVRRVIFNLAIKYLTTSVQYHSTKKIDTGWAVFPRWLGWQYLDKRENPIGVHDYIDVHAVSEIMILDGGTVFTTSIVDSTSGVTVGTISKMQLRPDGWFWDLSGLEFIYSGLEFATSGYIKFVDFYTFGSLSFTARAKNANETSIISIDTSRGNYQYALTYDEQTISFEPDIIDSEGTLEVTIRNIGENEIVTSAIFILGFLTGRNIVVAKTYDHQRFVIPERSFILNGLPLTSKIVFSTRSDYIDMRVTDYELYVQKSDDLYYLVAHAEVDGSWVDTTVDGETYVQSEMEYIDSDEIQTLNFNYGLGASVLVGVAGQTMVYSEVTLRGRQYFVNGTNRIHQSHIAGSGLLQPDSFPYDANTKYGFIEGEKEAKYIGVATTLYNELMVFANDNIGIFTIQYNTGGMAYKRLRTLSRGMGLVSLDTLVYAQGGLVWVDYSGVYFYGGGQNPPVNLLNNAFEHYWQENDIPSQIDFAFYYPKNNEYWLKVGDSFLIFELKYKTINRVSLSALGLSDNTMFYVGIEEGRPLLAYYDVPGDLVGINTYMLWWLGEQTYTSFSFTTHYTSGQLPYQVDKFLHSVYVAVRNQDQSPLILSIYVDGNKISELTMTPSIDHQIIRRLSPIGVRFNKIAFAVRQAENKLTEITEIGCKCSIITPPRGVTGEGVLSGGYGTGYGSNYGQQL